MVERESAHAAVRDGDEQPDDDSVVDCSDTDTHADSDTSQAVRASATSTALSARAATSSGDARVSDNGVFVVVRGFYLVTSEPPRADGGGLRRGGAADAAV